MTTEEPVTPPPFMHNPYALVTLPLPDEESSAASTGDETDSDGRLVAVSIETDQRRLSQRRKQISFGKATYGYHAWLGSPIPDGGADPHLRWVPQYLRDPAVSLRCPPPSPPSIPRSSPTGRLVG